MVPPRSQGSVHRTTTAACKYKLPFPISVLFKQYYGTPKPSEKLCSAFKLAEGIVRFLAYVSLSDALSVLAEEKVADEDQMGDASKASSEKGRKADRWEKQVQTWLRALDACGFGKLLWLFNDTSRFVFSHSSAEPFMPELEGLLKEKEWLESSEGISSSLDPLSAANEIKEERNRFAHRFLNLSDQASNQVLEKLNEPLFRMLGAIQFLRRYALGRFRESGASGRVFRYHWHPATGHVEDGCDPITLTGGQPTPHGVSVESLVVLDQTRGRVLHLARVS